MKNNLFRYGLVVSLLLNISFLGAAGYAHYNNTRNRPAPLQDGTPGEASINNCAIGRSHLFEELGLGAEQRKAFEEKAAPFHATLAKKQQDIDRLRISLLNQMRSAQIDSKAIEDAVVRISHLQEEMQKTVVSHMLEFKSMLNPDQQKRFFNLVDQAMTKRTEIQCP